MGWADGPGEWTDVGEAPDGTIALAVQDGTFFAATSAGRLWAVTFAELTTSPRAAWHDAGDSAGAVCLSGSNGRVYALGADHLIRTRLPVPAPAAWSLLGEAPGAAVLAAHAGLLVTAASGQPLRWRPAATFTAPWATTRGSPDGVPGAEFRSRSPTTARQALHDMSGAGSPGWTKPDS